MLLAVVLVIGCSNGNDDEQSLDGGTIAPPLNGTVFWECLCICQALDRIYAEPELVCSESNPEADWGYFMNSHPPCECDCTRAGELEGVGEQCDEPWEPAF